MSTSRPAKKISSFCWLLLVVAFLLVTDLPAQTIIVTTTNATGPGSLADAINQANLANATPHLITLASNTVYAYTLPDNFWYGPNALPPIASDITIEGNGSTLLSATNGRLRFFYVGADPSNAATFTYNSPGAGKLTLRHLTLTNGLALGGTGGGGGAGMGGAIFNQGILILDSVTLAGNTARGGNSGSDGGGFDTPATGGGGLGQDAVPGNSEANGSGYGAGFGGSVSPMGSQGAVAITPWGGGGGGFGVLDNADPTNGGGGGLPNGLGGNSLGLGGNGSGAGSGPRSSGSATYSGTAAPGGAFGMGGGVGGAYNIGFATLRAGGGAGGGVGGGGGGGGLGDNNAGLAGAGGFGGGGGVGQIGGGNGGGNGGFGGGGGASYDVSGMGGYGGGDSGHYDDLIGNGGGAGMGGAVFNHNGSVTLLNTTLTQNLAQGGNGGNSGVQGVGGNGGSGFGGALFNLNGVVNISSSTLASNVIVLGLAGTGIYDPTHGLGGNGSPGTAAGGALYSMVYDSAVSRTGAVTIVNSILAGSVGGSDVVNIFPATTSAGTNLGSIILTAREPNLIQTFTNSGGIFTSNGVLAANPLLGPLADNGGPTPTMLPLPGSPAIDAGDSKFAAATDQRGQPRISGASVDLGAVELPGLPFFTGVTFANAAQIQLQFRATAGLGYTVLTTTNLSQTNWTILGLATEISPGQFQITDTPATNSPARYYRVHHP